ncbi:MAG: hypothetical protein CVV64_08860 [Candidatus Wallbacteria bacterium HGW-Wallbacteria-1]|uniref:Glycosyltransferase RgtA/B/C/D-like domain-containing protein n=1 Tax=Candidatus Wallbacteria bacterium HGW-Wallbacteria-1 TaxID=2013854 RepID=A0A2N1PQ58_9BACT|nr:MAG: hypothetical protein CVV64_08860 [Candidatus Wallbacteria bacterium HGW-Wallbacteria-1]
MPSIYRRMFPALFVSILFVSIFAVNLSRCYMDDAYIGFRGVRNFIDGKGLRVNTGEGVEAFTNTAWPLFVALTAGPLSIPVTAKILGFGFLVLVFLLLPLVIDRLSAEGDEEFSGGIWFWVLILLAVSPSLVYFSLCGMETAPAALTLLVFVLFAHRGGGLVGGAAAAAAFAFRPDTITLVPVLILIDLFSAGTLLPASSAEPSLKARIGDIWRCRGRMILTLAVCLIIITGIRYGYYGSLLPNTFNSKPSNPILLAVNGVKLALGEQTNLPFYLGGPLGFGFLLIGLAELAIGRGETGRRVLAVILAGLFFCLYSLRDWTMMARYFAHYLPLAMLGLALAMEKLGRISESLARGKRGFFQTLIAGSAFFWVCTTIVFGNFMQWERHLGSSAAAKYPGYVLNCSSLEPVARQIGVDFRDSGFTIACRRLGVLSYFSGLSVLDYAFGLPHRDVALKVRKKGKAIDDPADPLLEEIWRSRSPALLLEDGFEMRKILKAQGKSTDETAGEWASITLHGIEYTHIRSSAISADEKWILYGDARAHAFLATPAKTVRSTKSSE